MKKVCMDLSETIKNKKYKISEKKCRGYEVVHFKVDSTNEYDLKRVKGDYFSINYNYFTLKKEENKIKKELIKILKFFFRDLTSKKTLIIGLGNSSIACDSLGVKTTDKVMATNHFDDFLSIPKVAVFNPSVIAKTGISSYSLINLVVTNLKPTAIIIIDSLATNKDEYLNNCIEVNNTGIIPGSAIKDSKKIDYKTFNIPIISIGVPLVLEKNKILYTTPNVNEIVNITSKIIANALNDLFF